MFNFIFHRWIKATLYTEFDMYYLNFIWTLLSEIQEIQIIPVKLFFKNMIVRIEDSGL